MMNQVVLVGRLSKDVELRYTPNGKAVASFTVAVDNGFGDNKKTDFINCVVWDKKAESTANYTKKGSLVGVIGRIQTRNYEGSDGKKVYVTEVLALEVKFLGSKGDENSSEGNSPRRQQNAPRGEKQANHNDPFSNGGQSIDISDDDLPF